MRIYWCVIIIYSITKRVGQHEQVPPIPDAKQSFSVLGTWNPNLSIGGGLLTSLATSSSINLPRQFLVLLFVLLRSVDELPSVVAHQVLV